jgi:hypothetical protein
MQGELLLWLAVQLALTGLPGVAATLFAARRGVAQVPVLLAIGMAASGVFAMLAFWAFYADPLVGKTVSYVVVLGSAMLIAWSLHEGGVDRALLRRLATPLALWVLGTSFLVFLGFVHGGTFSPLPTAATRFSGQLPSDNDIPRFFSEWFFLHGHQTPPEFPGEWLASDRPPLQVGYAVLERSFGWDDASLRYQVMGVALQQLWIVGLWALLVAARVGRVTRALTMITVLVSGLALVNGFFVWPKMLPAAMLLAAAALVVTPLWTEVRRSLWGAALVAALLGLAMLGHGASIFGVIPLAVVAAVRGLPSWRWIGVALLAGIALMGPWTAYQKYGDPPGNRLTKWYLAGVLEIDDRGVGKSIVDSYGEAGLGGTIDNKLDNFAAMSGGAPMVRTLEHAVEVGKAGDLRAFAEDLRGVFFFYLLPSLGLLLLAPFAMVAAWRRRHLNPDEWRFALTCFAVFTVGAIGWGLLLFGGSLASTVIHQGTYLLPIVGLCGCAAGLRAVLPRFAVWYLGLSAGLTLTIYAPSFEPLEGTTYAPAAAAIAAAFLAAFVFLSLRRNDAPQRSSAIRGASRLKIQTAKTQTATEIASAGKR